MARNRRETQGSSGPTRGAIGDYMIGALGIEEPHLEVRADEMTHYLVLQLSARVIHPFSYLLEPTGTAELPLLPASSNLNVLQGCPSSRPAVLADLLRKGGGGCLLVEHVSLGPLSSLPSRELQSPLWWLLR